MGAQEMAATPLGFGKYASLTYDEVYSRHHEYSASIVFKHVEKELKSKKARAFARWLMKTKGCGVDMCHESGIEGILIPSANTIYEYSELEEDSEGMEEDSLDQVAVQP